MSDAMTSKRSFLALLVLTACGFPARAQPASPGRSSKPPATAP